MDFITVLKSHIERLSVFTNIVDIGNFNDDGNRICLRPAPSQPPIRFLNRDITYMQGLQVLTRHSNHQTSLDDMQTIALNINNLYKNDIVSLNGSFIFVKASLNGTVNYVEKDNYGWVYTALFTAELYIK